MEGNKKGDSEKLDSKNDFLLLGFIPQKFIGLVLMICGAIIIIIFGLILFVRFFSAPSLAKILPLKSTLAFFEFNSGLFGSNIDDLQKISAEHPAYSSEKISSLLQENFALDFSKDVKPWLGGKFGMALIKDENNKSINEVFFLEYNNKDKALATLKKLQLTHPDDALISNKYGGFDLYSYKIANDLSFVFAEKYLIISPSYSSLKQIISTINKELAPVSNNPEYHTLLTNLEKNYLVFGFINLNDFIDSIGKSPKYARVIGGEISNFMPLLKIYKSFGVTVSTNENGFRAKTYTTIDKSLLQSGFYHKNKINYKGDLLKFVPSTSIAVFGGINLGGQISRLEDLLAETGSSSSLVLRGELNNLIKAYVDTNKISTDQILNLLQNEYVFFVGSEPMSPSYNFILELDSPTIAEQLPDFLNDALVKFSANKNPILRNVTLQDGTDAQEYIIDLSTVKLDESTINEGKIYTFSASEKGEIISYGIKQNYFIISNKKADLVYLISELDSNKQDNANASSFSNPWLLSKSDEITHINLNYLWPSAKFIPSSFLDYFTPVKTFQSGKEYFESGVAAEYFLELN